MCARDIDSVVGAELSTETAMLFDLEKRHMVHGPSKGRECFVEDANGDFPCARRFPKHFRSQASAVADDHYARYRRRSFAGAQVS